MVQVGEAAIDQGADEVHRHRRTRVALHHPAWIRSAGVGGEFRQVDEVAAVARKRYAVALFDVRGAWLRVLARETADAVVERLTFGTATRWWRAPRSW